MYPDMQGRKMVTKNVSIRGLLRDVNNVGLAYDLKYRELHPDVDYRFKQFSKHGADNEISLDPGATPNKSPGHINSHSRSPMNRDNSGAVVNALKSDHRDTIPELKLRDLRRLDNHFNHHEEPYILIRRHCVLISLGPHIRAIVQAERLLMLVFNDGGGEGVEGVEGVRILELLEDVITKLMPTATPEFFRHSTSANSFDKSAYAESLAIPFEARAYGVLFSVTHSLLQKDFHEHSYHSTNMIDAIADHTILSVRLQELMHSNKDNVTDLLARIKGVRRLVSALLEEDDDLLFLNLAVLQTDPSIYALAQSDASAVLYSRYADIEPLMDSVLIDFRSMENQAETLLRKLVYIEQSVNLRLDTSRNELLYATTVMSVFASTVAFSGYITGAFGMNLDNVDFIQPVKGTFWAVFITSFLLFITSAVLILCVLSHYKILPSHAHLLTAAQRKSGSMDGGAPGRRMSIDHGPGAFQRKGSTKTGDGRARSATTGPSALSECGKPA
eukprot:gene36986-45622_t